jgi:hypothetical protein
MAELCGAAYPGEEDVHCGMPIGPNATTAPVRDPNNFDEDGLPILETEPVREVHVHVGYGGDEIPPAKFRWEDVD